MSRDFKRRVPGFNRWWHKRGSGSMPRDYTLTLVAPDGPGRIQEYFLMHNDPGETTSMSNLVTVTVDGVVVISDSAWTFFYQYDGVLTMAPLCSRCPSFSWYAVQRIMNIDYESSASIAIKNTASPDPTSFYVVMTGDVGR
jgi:hypothetical protein